MAISLTLEKFYEYHPYPDKYRDGITSLFRFYKIDLDREIYLRHLFTERKLYHSLPSQFNDPFECKPHFSWPKDPKKVIEIRQHLEKSIRERGCSRQNARATVSGIMRKRKLLETIVFGAAQKSFSELRMCCFTTRKDNLLLWSHYADSHRGFCVEFDATKLPISSAFKVHYSNEYPEVAYPPPNDETAFIPALVKSEVWEYEDEFRTIFHPEAEDKPANDGESLILEGDEIKNVYLGSDINENNKKLIIDLVKQGNFKPGIWITSLAKSAFSLEFAQVG